MTKANLTTKGMFSNTLPKAEVRTYLLITLLLRDPSLPTCFVPALVLLHVDEVLLDDLGLEELLVVRLAVDDALVADVGVQVEELVALLAPEAVLAPPRLLGNDPLHDVGLLAAHL